jgi:hypothetical protein
LDLIYGVLLELKGNLWLELAAILTLALIGYAVLKGLLARVERGTQHTQLRWDDVVVNALTVPSRVAYWVLVVFFGVGLAAARSYGGLSDLFWVSAACLTHTECCLGSSPAYYRI